MRFWSLFVAKMLLAYIFQEDSWDLIFLAKMSSYGTNKTPNGITLSGRIFYHFRVWLFLTPGSCAGYFYVTLEVDLTTLFSKIFCFSDFFGGTGRDRQTFLGKYYFRWGISICVSTQTQPFKFVFKSWISHKVGISFWGGFGLQHTHCQILQGLDARTYSNGTPPSLGYSTLST